MKPAFSSDNLLQTVKKNYIQKDQSYQTQEHPALWKFQVIVVALLRVV